MNLFNRIYKMAGIDGVSSHSGGTFTTRPSFRRGPENPKKKAKVEGAVLLAERWILARLRNQCFFGLDAVDSLSLSWLTGA